jgi:hypothetical protein
MNRKPVNRKTEQGQALIVAVLVMAVVLGFTAMAIDIGLMYEERRDMQNAADAAALAGAQYLPQDPSEAVATAQQWALNNGIDAAQITAIQVQSTNVSNDTIYVELDNDFSWVFGKVLGLTSSNVGAQAKAVVGSLGGNNNMMPWALLQGDSQCLDAQGDAIFGANCVVKVGAGGAITGWYGALDFDGNGGGSAEYKANIIDGTTDWRYCIDGDPSPACVSAVTVIDALHGNKVGPTDQGIDTRTADAPCDSDGNGRDDFDEVFTPTGGSPPYVVSCPESGRLIIIPIVSYTSEPVHTVTIEGWSLAYLDTYWCSEVSSDPLGESGSYVLAGPAPAAPPKGKDCTESGAAPRPTATPPPPPAGAAFTSGSGLEDLYVLGPVAGPLPAPARCHHGSPHGMQTCAPTPTPPPGTPTPTPSPTPTPTPTPPPATPTPSPTPAGSPTPAPSPGGACHGNGHWEVQIQIVDAAYSQATGFITAYDEESGITIRKLVE